MDRIPIQVLVVTMHETNTDIFKRLNIQSDAVIANQADSDYIVKENIDGHEVLLVTTKTRGASKNRNIAMDNISPNTEIAVFADNDLSFLPGYAKMVMEEFETHPKADVIRFNIVYNDKSFAKFKPTKSFRRVYIGKKVTHMGVFACGFRVSVLKEKGLRFNERFGPGTENYCGEDSIFLWETVRSGCRFYASPKFIGELNPAVTTWDEGPTYKRHMVGGMVLNEIYGPLLCIPMAIRSAWKYGRNKNCKLSFREVLKANFEGFRKNRKERKALSI